MSIPTLVKVPSSSNADPLAKIRTSCKKTDGYHHGELPEVLMDLALKHIEQHGTEKLSLRALAREAEVSPTAPYRHFSSKQCLLAAIATQGFHRLRQRQVTSVIGICRAEDRVIAMALAYLEFAIANPTAYKLMFGSLLGDFSEFEMLQQAVTASYSEVDAVLDEVIASRGMTMDKAQLGGVLWSSLHGMSSLLINEVTVGKADAKPMLAIAALRRDHEAALRLMFGQILGEIGA